MVVFDNLGNYGYFPRCDPSVVGTSAAFYADWDAAAINDTSILTSKGASLYWVLGPYTSQPTWNAQVPIDNSDYLAIAATTPNVYTIDAWTAFGGATENFSLRAPDLGHLDVAGDQLITSVITQSIPATVPSAPLSISATAGNGSAQVSWAVPASNGSAITGYTVAAFDMTRPSNDTVFAATSSPVTVTGLTNGDTYLFAMTATNRKGTGPAAADWTPVVPTTVPDAPTSVTATPGNGSAQVSLDHAFGQRQSDHRLHGDRHRHDHALQRGADGQRSTGPVTVTGLTNGDSYTFTVTATNALGTGAASAASSLTVPTTVPDPPTSVTATPGNGSAQVAWTTPSANGSPITGYTVTATDTTTPSNGGQTVSASTGPVTVTGLTNGDSYTFTVTATNALGTGAASAASSPVLLATAPDAPSEVLAAPDSDNDPGTLLVYFYPGFDEGSPVLGYTVTITDLTNPADPNNGLTVEGSDSPVTVTGLTSGDTYSFSVMATNALGASGPSAASDGVASP